MKMRPAVALVMAVAVLGAGGAWAAERLFADVPDDHRRIDAIRYAKDEGLFLGFPDGNLRPDDELSEGQFLKVAERLYDRRDVWTRADWAQMMYAGLPSLTAAAGGDFVPGSLGIVAVAPGDDIQIRSLEAISGDVAFLGIPNQRATKMAIEDYGPIRGHDVTFGVGLDDLCSPDGGRAAARQIAADPQVAGVIGTSCSAAAVAASPLISAAGLVMISSTNTSPALTSDLAGAPGPSWNKGYYRVVHNDLFQGRAVAEFFYNALGLKRAAAIHDGDPYTQGLATAFANDYRALGGAVTAVATVNKGDTDMTPVLTEVAAGSPQALFFPIFPPEGGYIAGQVGSVSGMEDVVLAGAGGLLVDNHLELPESEGMYFSGPDLRYGSNRNEITGKSADEFLAQYQSEYGEAPSAAFWAHAYDATTMLLAAIDVASVAEGETLLIDRAALRAAVDAAMFDGIIGPVSCDDYGDCGTGKITVVHHTDSGDIEAGKQNVVFSFSP